jgi:hypothetical protein
MTPLLIFLALGYLIIFVRRMSRRAALRRAERNLRRYCEERNRADEAEKVRKGKQLTLPD